MNEKEKAEAYVRTKLPELMELSFGCRGVTNDRTWVMMQNGNWVIEDSPLDSYSIFEPREIIGHPIRMNDWLRVLLAREIPKNEYKETVFIKRDGTFTVGWVDDIKQESGVYAVKFNFTTGQPATEADYQAFNQIVGI
jgi:hypothetical protein